MPPLGSHHRDHQPPRGRGPRVRPDRGDRGRADRRARVPRGAAGCGRDLRRPLPEPADRGADRSGHGRGAGVSDAEEVLGRVYDGRLLARVFSFTRPYLGLVAVVIVSMPLLAALELAQPYALKVMIDAHIRPRRLDGMDLVGLVLVGLLAAEYLGRFGQSYLMQLLGQRAMNDLRIVVYRHVMSLGMAFFDRTPIGRVMTRLTSDVESLNEMFAAGIIAALSDVVKLAAIVGWLLYLHPRLALVTFCALPLLGLLTLAFRRLARTAFREIKVRIARINQFLQEHVSGMKVVQLHRRESAVASEFDRENGGFRDANRGAITYDAALFALVEAIASIAVAAIIWYGGRALVADLPAARAAQSWVGDGRAPGGMVTIGLLVAFIEYVNRFFVPIRDLSSKYTTMQSAMASAERLFALLDTQVPDAPRLDTDEDAVAVPGGARIPKIAIEGVRFGYRDGADVLHDLSIEVPTGGTVAVIGATGSGKSTLVKLIGRLYELRAGRILLDGHDIRRLASGALRRRVSVVSQDGFLFTGSIADNVTLGDQAIGRAEVEQALARVGLTERLAGRGGADARVIERGANFSAGERQLLAFARALARDPEVLILDEATASVDPEAEGLIERALAELMRGRTSIVIAHRLSTIRRAGRIVALHKGRVVEQGTHEELIARGGLYARLYAIQHDTAASMTGSR
ncbi:MAG: ABC transporter ATP-binding protein [Myxococcales bacterium]|nr:ABC transporter ATP-binding protein [Myxococcales bacterium]